MEDKNQKPAKTSSPIQSTHELFKKAGFKHVQKTGAILMPLSKSQRESLEKKKKPE